MRSSVTKANTDPRSPAIIKGSILLCLAIAAGSFCPDAAAQAAESAADSAPAALGEDGTPPGENGAALADLVVNGENRGTVDFFLDSSGSPLLPSSLLRRILAPLARPEIVAAFGTGEVLVLAADIRALGMGIEYDPTELSLSITVPPEDMLPVDIGSPASRGGLKGETELKNAGYAATLGLSLDLAPEYLETSYDRSLSPEADLELSPSLAALGFVAEGDMDISYSGGLDTTVNAARLLRDFPDLGARASLGIVNTGLVSFQSSQELLGLSFARETTLPGAQREAKRIIDEFVLERDADVTVAVNGTTIRKLRLPPGSYRLSDLPLSSGLNEVSVKIEEEGKEARWARLGLPFDSAVLDPGEIDYSLTLGADRSDPSEAFGSGSIARGFVGGWEFGVDGEAGFGILLGGLTALWASPFGSLGAASGLCLPYSGSPTPAYGERLYWRYFSPSRRYLPRLGAAIEYRSAGFTAPRDDLATNAPPTSPTWNLSTQASEALPWGGSLTLFGDCTLEGGSVSDASFTLGATIPIRSFTSLYLSGGVDWSSGEEAAPRCSALLSITTPDRRSLQYRQDFVDRKDSVDLSIDLDKEGRNSIGCSEEGLASSEADRSLELTGRSKTRYVNYSASGRYYRSGDDSYTELTGSFAASTNLAFADGRFGAASSFGNAIALLVPAPAMGEERVELRSASGATMSTAAGRTAVISGLTPYEDFAASIEMPDSPPERRPSPASLEFLPTYRSITLLKVGVASSVSISGRLVDANLSPKKNLSGDIIDSGGRAVPFAGTFTDDDGSFECFGLSPGRAAIRWNDGSTSSFAVPEGEPGAFFDLGDVGATMPEVDGGTP